MEKCKYMKPRTTRAEIQNEYYILAVSGGGSAQGLNNGGFHNTGQSANPEEAALSKMVFMDFN